MSTPLSPCRTGFRPVSGLSPGELPGPPTFLHRGPSRTSPSLNTPGGPPKSSPPETKGPLVFRSPSPFSTETPVSKSGHPSRRWEGGFGRGGGGPTPEWPHPIRTRASAGSPLPLGIHPQGRVHYRPRPRQGSDSRGLSSTATGCTWFRTSSGGTGPRPQRSGRRFARTGTTGVRGTTRVGAPTSKPDCGVEGSARWVLGRDPESVGPAGGPHPCHHHRPFRRVYWCVPRRLSSVPPPPGVPEGPLSVPSRSFPDLPQDGPLSRGPVPLSPLTCPDPRLLSPVPRHRSSPAPEPAIGPSCPLGLLDSTALTTTV